MAYYLPEEHVFLFDDWLNNLRMDLVETLKRMMFPGRNFKTRMMGEYDTVSLRAPYRFIALMLNRIFGRAHGKSFKLGWMPIIFMLRPRGPSSTGPT